MSLQVDVRKIDVFNSMAKEGSRTVAEHLGQLTGLDSHSHISKLNFLDFADLEAHLGGTTRIGIYIGLDDPPHGYILFLLDADGSRQIAGAMMGEDPTAVDLDREGFTDMERSAMQEVGNILTSAFIDGWAAVLGTTIDISTPTFAYGPAGEMPDQFDAWPDRDTVFVIDSEILVGEIDLEFEVYTFPELEPLVELIRSIDLEGIDGEGGPGETGSAGEELDIERY